MKLSKLTQERFDRLFRTAKADEDVCVFKKCPRKPILTIQRETMRYGVCDRHWRIIAKSDVEWSSTKEKEGDQDKFRMYPEMDEDE